jgi:hypothetical protein
MWGTGSFPSLIPVLGTGIQPRRVCAATKAFPFRESPAPRDFGALDSCDKHRNEGDGLPTPRRLS